MGAAAAAAGNKTYVWRRGRADDIVIADAVVCNHVCCAIAHCLVECSITGFLPKRRPFPLLLCISCAYRRRWVNTRVLLHIPDSNASTPVRLLRLSRSTKNSVAEASQVWITTCSDDLIVCQVLYFHHMCIVRMVVVPFKHCEPC